ncbi:SCO family protein [Kroppenstedtia pulmonis]|uniref:SCO family protein n=1 Tax=Kroppenstedtia pulmonis TaxID=1380685 RepID=A0A7D4BID5_9BACL|nr:SCO family protein [Kroppenstedtia pulmonis]QKG83550.1 SCO family protein [Kroppenstedtia pulmonis]
MVSGNRGWKNRWVLLCGVLILLVTGYGLWGKQDSDYSLSSGEEKEASHLPDFRYTDQNGKVIGMDQLKGEIWLANQVFTRCPDICSPMTANMARVQQELKEAGLDIRIVSFSVDPEHDTPKVLKRFGENLKVDFSNWHFLTHEKEEQMHQFLKQSFKAPIKKRIPKSPGDVMTISHSSRFYLIDPGGKIRGTYNGLQPDYARIVSDASKAAIAVSAK